MAFLVGELSTDEGLHELFGDVLADHTTSQTEHVDVVVFDRLVCGVGVVGHSGADSIHLVGSDARSRSGA